MPDEAPRLLDRRREQGPRPRVPAAMERHLQTVLVALVCGVLAWMGNKVTATSEVLAALRAENRVQVAQLESEIKRLEIGVSRATSTAESLRELAHRDAAIKALEERVRYLERQSTITGLLPWAGPPPAPRSQPRQEDRDGR